ncbi:MAG TPA: hypothetical protein V6D11_12320 [Waterburya sp.]|jgi:hypothetical protein
MTHPSIDKHIKRIQSQLTRLGVRLSKDQIREVYREVVGDFANPTDEERALVVEKLSQVQEVSELATVEAPAIAVADDKPQAIAPVADECSSAGRVEAEPLPTHDGSSTSTAETGIILQSPEKQALIVQQASALNVQLDANELQVVTANVADTYSNFEEACRRIKEVLLAVLNQRHDRATGVLNDTLLTIINTASHDFQDLSQKASTGFNLIAEQLGGMNTDFKSRTDQIEASLKQFLLY